AYLQFPPKLPPGFGPTAGLGLRSMQDTALGNYFSMASEARRHHRGCQAPTGQSSVQCFPADAIGPNLSANQSLMSDCRVTPRRRASRSRESTIHAGKSTLTRLASVPTRRARFRSRCSVTRAPLSNLRSNVFAFINRHLLRARTPYGNQPNIFISPRYDRGPALLAYLAD